MLQTFSQNKSGRIWRKSPGEGIRQKAKSRTENCKTRLLKNRSKNTKSKLRISQKFCRREGEQGKLPKNHPLKTTFLRHYQHNNHTSDHQYHLYLRGHDVAHATKEQKRTHCKGLNYGETKPQQQKMRVVPLWQSEPGICSERRSEQARV